MVDRYQEAINNDLIGKALDNLERCRFKRGGKMDKIHDELNAVYESKTVTKETIDK